MTPDPKPANDGLPPNEERMQADARKIGEGLLALGGVVSGFYVGLDYLTTWERTPKGILAFGLACLLIGVVSVWFGEPGYPRYGKRNTNIAFGLGVVACCIFLGLFFTPPTPSPVITMFDVDMTPWERRDFVRGKDGEVILRNVRNMQTNEVLPAMDTGSSAVVFLAIAKDKAATELLIRHLSVEIVDYQPLKGKWQTVVEGAAFAKYYDYSATLKAEKAKVNATHKNRSDPQITTDATNYLHLRLTATRTGIYTLAFKVEGKSVKQSETKETKHFKLVVLEGQKDQENNDELIPPKQTLK